MNNADISNFNMQMRRIEDLLREISEKLDKPMNITVNVQAPSDFTAGELAEVIGRAMRWNAAAVPYAGPAATDAEPGGTP